MYRLHWSWNLKVPIREVSSFQRELCTDFNIPRCLAGEVEHCRYEQDQCYYDYTAGNTHCKSYSDIVGVPAIF